MSKKESVTKVIWDADLHVSKGDEIEILSGIIDVDNVGNVYAFELRNITKGRREIREIIRGNMFAQKSPEQFKPSIHGIVKNIFVSPSGTWFELEDITVLGNDLNKLIKETDAFLDKEIIEKCLHKKDAEDIITSAFRILEERIRTKIGEGYDKCGLELLTDAFHPKTGRLIFGKSPAEQEALLLLYRGSIGFLRNPPSHRFVDDYSKFEIFEIVVHVNLLLTILDKCKTRAS